MYKSLEQIIREVATWGEVVPGPDFAVLNEGKQKPYVSSDRDGAHVIGPSGKIVKSFKDIKLANAYLRKTYDKLKNEESEVKLEEGGHDDVSSMKTKVDIGLKAFENMKAALEKLPDEGSIPTWWTNKVATAVARIDDMSDYLDTKMNGEKDAKSQED